MRQKVEEYFRELEEKIDKEIEAFTVEWRQYEAFAQIQLREGFYTFIIFSWSDEEDCVIEYMIGDENAVIQPNHLDKLEVAVGIIKLAHELATQKFACLQRS
ncbi:conserved hypothetical protein [Pyrobaculum islandicum DSM 4184]|uniref:Uncharacterized protein n=1 Tax=Pyrobaculum islandicum (strain DSM 4184 / JCM 9189 / GEO3) TaxID=384616 RepID=A1RV47_PYRIL|nr:hypothetical protein [Pyrobaculum islandicum]ABL88829.1 conserved hypothetical protein [Pyrobaculum islandicum DSM 4184]